MRYLELIFRKRRYIYWSLVFIILIVWLTIVIYYNVVYYKQIREFCLYYESGCNIFVLNNYISTNRENYELQVRYYLAIKQLLNESKELRLTSEQIHQLNCLYLIDFSIQAFMDYRYLFFVGIFLFAYILIVLIWFNVFLYKWYQRFKYPWFYDGIDDKLNYYLS